MARHAEERGGLHLMIRPGTDYILGTALIQEVLRRDAWDKAFVERWVSGFDVLQKAAMQDRFSLENATRATGVSAEKIKAAADLLIANKGKTMVLHEKGKRFFTKDNKAHLEEMVLVGKFDHTQYEWGGVDAAYPLMAFDFRLNELWNTGYTYWDKPTVSSRTPDALLEMNVTDARSRGIQNEDWVVLKSKYGECKAQARVHDDVILGSVGIPALFPKAGQEFNYVTAPTMSPINGNFDTMVAVQVRKA